MTAGEEKCQRHKGAYIVVSEKISLLSFGSLRIPVSSRKAQFYSGSKNGTGKLRGVRKNQVRRCKVLRKKLFQNKKISPASPQSSQPDLVSS
jgi:hypothetical protein